MLEVANKAADQAANQIKTKPINMEFHSDIPPTLTMNINRICNNKSVDNIERNIYQLASSNRDKLTSDIIAKIAAAKIERGSGKFVCYAGILRLFMCE